MEAVNEDRGMKVSQLQGTPWHHEQIIRQCDDGSKHCIYNRNICICKQSKYHNLKCVGKGVCDWFESKSGEPKSVQTSYIIGNLANKKNKNPSIQRREPTVNHETSQQKESKKDKFLRLSQGRINKIDDAISNLENLADKHLYDYNDDQVDKMFGYLEKRLKSAKDKFRNKNSSGGFEW